jgi:hypothetical protein
MRRDQLTGINSKSYSETLQAEATVQNNSQEG